MASSGPNFNAAAAIVNGPGTDGKTWYTESNAITEDGSVSGTDDMSKPVYDYAVYIIKGGSRAGSNQATSTSLNTSLTYRTYSGGLWGTTLTPSEVNASNFGVSFAIQGSSQQSRSLHLTDFGFSIPTDATIDSVVAEIRQYRSDGGFSDQGFVDCAKITVNYTEAATGHPAMRRFSQCNTGLILPLHRPIEIGRTGTTFAKSRFDIAS